MATEHRTAVEVGSDIIDARQRFLDHDRRGQYAEADDDYQLLDELLEEYGHIPKQRPPSD